MQYTVTVTIEMNEGGQQEAADRVKDFIDVAKEAVEGRNEWLLEGVEIEEVKCGEFVAKPYWKRDEDDETS
jgi:hypothetical protein